jgi:hypothetical protein
MECKLSPSSHRHLTIAEAVFLPRRGASLSTPMSQSTYTTSVSTSATCLLFVVVKQYARGSSADAHGTLARRNLQAEEIGEMYHPLTPSNLSLCHSGSHGSSLVRNLVSTKTSDANEVMLYQQGCVVSRPHINAERLPLRSKRIHDWKEKYNPTGKRSEAERCKRPTESTEFIKFSKRRLLL